MRIIAQTPEETMKIAGKLAETFSGGEVVGLDGGLGAGKTVFVKGFARGLGVRAAITSPTFNIVREYAGRLPLYHFDVYRIEEPEEMFEVGFAEYLSSGGVTIIEWASRVEALLPPGCIRVEIQGAGEDARVLEICGMEEERLKAALQ